MDSKRDSKHVQITPKAMGIAEEIYSWAGEWDATLYDVAEIVAAALAAEAEKYKSWYSPEAVETTCKLTAERVRRETLEEVKKNYKHRMDFYTWLLNALADQPRQGVKG